MNADNIANGSSVTPVETKEDNVPKDGEARRRRALEDADASNRIEGLHRDESTNDIFESYVRGELEPSELVPAIKKRLGVA